MIGTGRREESLAQVVLVEAADSVLTAPATPTPEVTVVMFWVPKPLAPMTVAVMVLVRRSAKMSVTVMEPPLDTLLTTGATMVIPPLVPTYSTSRVSVSRPSLIIGAEADALV